MYNTYPTKYVFLALFFFIFLKGEKEGEREAKRESESEREILPQCRLRDLSQFKC